MKWLVACCCLAGLIPVRPVAQAAPDAPAAPEPRLVAHRGLLRHAPENTLANFRACLSLGLGFETDLQRTRDGHLVCIHDATVDRTTNGTGAVADLTLAQLRALDAGRWFSPTFAGQRVPTLDEVFGLVRDLGGPAMLVAMDFKGSDERLEGDMVAAAKRFGVLDRLLSIGKPLESAAARRRLRAADPGARTARLVGSPAELPQALGETDSDWIYLRFMPSREQVAAIHGAKKRVFIAGPLVVAAQPENWRLARERGLDALLTDEPLEVRALWRSGP